MSDKGAVLLRICTSEYGYLDGEPQFERIVRLAREAGLACATATRSLIGHGRSGHGAKSEQLYNANNRPVVIELIDSEERIMAFWSSIESLLHEAFVTTERVTILR
jgi:PII-like signaling protein